MTLWPATGFPADKVLPPEPPRREGYVKYSYQVVLPENMRKALKAYSPDFRIFGMEDYSEDFKKLVPLTFSSTVCYSAVFADINKDGRDDAVLRGEGNVWVEHRNGERGKYFPTIAVLSDGTTGYRVVEMSRGIARRPVEEGLTVLAAGTAIDNWDYTTVNIKDNDIGLIITRL